MKSRLIFQSPIVDLVHVVRASRDHLVVRGDDESRAGTLLHRMHQIHDAAAGDRVEIRCRLIREH